MKRFIRLSAMFVSIASILLTSIPVSAQSNALGITPRKDFTIKAGDSQKDNLTITNLDKENPLIIKLNLIDFKAQNETGAPELMRDKSLAPTT